MFSSFQLFGHLGDLTEVELLAPPIVLSGDYVAEDGVTFYVAENGTDNYVTET